MFPKVTLHTKPCCPYCARAKALLQQRGVSIEDIEITDDPVLTTEMEQRSGRRTVPQIFVGDVHVGGASDLFALEAAGRLDPLLQTERAA